MSKKTRYIAMSNLPPAPPRVVWMGITVWLLMDRLGAPQWSYGIVFTLIALLFILSCAAIWHSEPVDLLKEHEGK